MTEQKFEDIKKGYLENIKKYLLEAGGLFPHISIFADHKNEDKPESAIIHIPIPEKFMNSDKAKSAFVEKVLPEIAQKVKEEFNIFGVAWASEAWLRVGDAKDPNTLNDWKKLPVQKEVLIMTLESADENSTSVFEIKRNGKQVNADGELVDHIELLDLPEFKDGKSSEGRFTGLFKKLTGND